MKPLRRHRAALSMPRISSAGRQNWHARKRPLRPISLLSAATRSPTRASSIRQIVMKGGTVVRMNSPRNNWRGKRRISAVPLLSFRLTVQNARALLLDHRLALLSLAALHLAAAVPLAFGWVRLPP